MNDYYGIIYKVTNIQNKKCYIGKSKVSLNRRKSGHLSRMNSEKCKNIYFYNAIKKYGWNNFKWEVFGYCYSLEELNKSEILCIEFFKSNNKIYGYNSTKGGDGGDTFTYHSNKEEHRKKNSEAQKIAQNRPEVKIKQRIAQKIAQNIPEIKNRKIEALKLAYKNNPERKEKQSRIMKIWWSDPTNKASTLRKIKISTNTPEYKEKERLRTSIKENNPMYGKHHTKESNLKNRNSHLGINNARYGKSNYDLWLEKYGKEIADQKEKERRESIKKNWEKRKNI